MVEFAHSETTFSPHPEEHPEWNGYDQIDESGFHDATRRARREPVTTEFGQRIDVSNHVPAPTSVPARELHRP